MDLPSSENICYSKEENLCRLLSSKGKCLEDSSKAFCKVNSPFERKL